MNQSSKQVTTTIHGGGRAEKICLQQIQRDGILFMAVVVSILFDCLFVVN